MKKGFVERYADFVTTRYVLVLSVLLVFTALAMWQASSVETVSSDFKDLLPEGFAVIDAFTDLEDIFGGVENIAIVLTVEPHEAGSSEVRDIRDSRVLTYERQIETLVQSNEDVLSVSSLSKLLYEQNGNRLPKSIPEAQALIMVNPAVAGVLSGDNTLTVINVRVSDDADLSELGLEFQQLVRDYSPPVGVVVRVAGRSMEDVVVQELMPQDMAKTSKYSLIGIFLVILLVFRSFKYGVTPLSTILFGTVWAFGYVGLVGMGLNSQTSGVVSMIMGIGIDFGIQTVTRYRQERKNFKTNQKAMSFSLQKVIPPMTTTTIAAVIGFQAMGLGQLTFLAEMGTIMSFGVVGSFFAAISVLPTIILLFDEFSFKKILYKVKR